MTIKPKPPPDEAAQVKRKALENLQAASARLVLTHGFFAGAVLRKRLIPNATICPTIGTDGKDLYYNPAWVAERSIAECVGLLVHEACHDLGLHPFREQGRDHIGWNIACDMVCNQVVEECGLSLPEGGVPAKKDTTPEAEYEKVMKKKRKAPCNCAMVKPRDGNGQELTGAAKAAAEAEARLAAATVAELAKRAGKLPAGLARLVGAALEERVPWPQIVSRFVTQSAKMESAWRRPNRRFLTHGVVLPSLWSPDVPDFVLACDTSGSIDTETLRLVCGEVLHALSTCERRGAPALTVLWCDTEVSAQVVECEKDLEPKGGGGTMFSPVFAWVNEHAAMTKGVVYLTDGYCADFGETPEYPVLWILTAPNPGFVPPFGEVACVL